MSSATKTAIVTGASSGIGAATAIELGRAGFHVALGARRIERLRGVAKEIEAVGGAAFAHELDVIDGESMDLFCEAATKALGSPKPKKRKARIRYQKKAGRVKT